MVENRVEKLMDELRGPIQEFIESLEPPEAGLPRARIAEADDLGHRRRTVARPGRLLLGATPSKGLVETATHLHDSGRGWLREDELNPGGEPGAGRDPNEAYAEDLVHLAASTLDYSGELGWDGDAYEAAFRATVEWRYERKRRAVVIIPILNLEGPDDDIELDSNVPLDTDYGDDFDLGQITLGPLSWAERSGIATQAINSSFSTTTLSSGGFRSKLRLEYTASTTGGFEGDIGTQVLTALRLYMPEASDINIGPRYWHEPGFLHYRFGICDITSTARSIAEPDFAFGPRNQLTQGHAVEFQQFWSRLGGLVRPGGSKPLSVGLRRFSQSFTKPGSEDRILDLVIGFESTVLKDVGRTDSYRFRLPLRMAILLGGATDERDFRHKLLKELYDTRSRIVHEGQHLDDKEVADAKYSPREFVFASRDLLRQALLKYVEEANRGQSIEELNRQLDRAARSAEYSPAEPNSA